MDFMKLLKSIEELLYELISWVIFYPLTLWRIMRQPLATLSYAERELQEPEGQQYDDGVSPPIFLLITLGLLHIIGQAIMPSKAAVMTGVFADARNLLAFRAIAFSFFPLIFGLIQLKVGRSRVTRSTFRPVFYSQGYATVPFVIAISLGIGIMGNYAESMAYAWWGLALLLVGLLWYGTVQSRWLASSAPIGIVWSVLLVIVTLICAVPFFFLVGAIVGYAASVGQLI